MTNLIVAKQLSKEFQKYKAIENLNFTVEKGEILGFLGPSGSGKTTTINILTGQLSPSQGETYILGKSSLQLKEDDLSKIGLIKKMAKLYNVSTEYVDDLLKRVGLYDHRKTLAEKLSTGMKQRMLLVRAIINKPKVLFLDEPTSGLDPSTSQTIHSLIEELKQQGTTIFLTTHDMHEATILCDNIVLLNKGKIVEEGKPADLIQKYNTNKMVKVTYCSGQEKVIPFSELNHITAAQDIQTIHSCEPTLEDIFIQLTGGKLNV